MSTITSFNLVSHHNHLCIFLVEQHQRQESVEDTDDGPSSSGTLLSSGVMAGTLLPGSCHVCDRWFNGAAAGGGGSWRKCSYL